MDGQTDRWTTTMPIARPLLKYGPQTNHSQSHINYISYQLKTEFNRHSRFLFHLTRYQFCFYTLDSSQQSE